MGATHRGKQRKAKVGNGIAELSQLGHGSVSLGISQQRNCCSKPGRVISSSASSLGPGKSSEDPAQMPPIVLTFVFSLSTLRSLLTSPCCLLHPLSLLHPNIHKTSLQFRQRSARLSFLLCDLVTCPLSEFLHDQGHPSLHFQGLSWVNS